MFPSPFLPPLYHSFSCALVAKIQRHKGVISRYIIRISCHVDVPIHLVHPHDFTNNRHIREKPLPLALPPFSLRFHQ